MLKDGFIQSKVLREWKNIDVLIKLNDVVICIENKVLSKKEHSNQLKRYREIIENDFPNEKKDICLLNTEGDEQKTKLILMNQFHMNLWLIKRIISVYGESLNQQVKNYKRLHYNN